MVRLHPVTEGETNIIINIISKYTIQYTTITPPPAVPHCPRKMICLTKLLLENNIYIYTRRGEHFVKYNGQELYLIFVQKL